MNSRKLSKEKRNRLVLVALATLIAVAGLYFLLIQRQNEGLARLAQKKAAAAKTPVDAVDFAMGMEKDSILYYIEAGNFVPSNEKKIIDGIVNEERKHFNRLAEVKKLL